jgi:hypothetical protein
VSHPVLGSALYPTVPYKLSETPASIVSCAPLLGQHSGELAALIDQDANAAVPRIGGAA